MKRIFLILCCFIFAAQVYAKEGNKKETKQAPFDHEAYKAYEEGLMNPPTEEIFAENVKLVKVFTDAGLYCELFNKNSGESIRKFTGVRVDISEDKNYTFILPDDFHGFPESEKVVLFDNVNLKMIWEKEVKWFKGRYGRYKAGTAGISKHGEMVGIVLSPKKFLESPIHDIIVLNRKGKLVAEMQYAPHFLGGVDDTLEFSPKLKLLIGKESYPLNKVFSIENGKYICDSKMISISNNEKYIAAVKEAPEFSEVGRTEEDEPGTFSSSAEEREEYFRIMKGDAALYKGEEIVSDRDMANVIEPYVYIYDTDTGEIVGNIRVSMKQPYHRKWQSTSGGSIAVSPVKEIKFNQNDSKIIVTTEYEGGGKQQEFAIKEGIEFKKYQNRAFKKLKEKRLARQKEEKIPSHERDRRGRIKNLRAKVQDIRKTAKERGLDKSALRELKQIEETIKDNIEGTTPVRIRTELAKFEVKYDLMGHVSFIEGKWYIRIVHWDNKGGKNFRNKERVLKIFPDIHPAVLKELEKERGK